MDRQDVLAENRARFEPAERSTVDVSFSWSVKVGVLDVAGDKSGSRGSAMDSLVVQRLCYSLQRIYVREKRWEKVYYGKRFVTRFFRDMDLLGRGLGTQNAIRPLSLVWVVSFQVYTIAVLCMRFQWQWLTWHTTSLAASSIPFIARRLSLRHT